LTKTKRRQKAKKKIKTSILMRFGKNFKNTYFLLKVNEIFIKSLYILQVGKANII
jgi:hypothetical protein